MPKPTYVTTLGQLRQELAHLPDETALFMTLGDVNEEHWELSVDKVLPATSTQYPAVILCAGQSWDYEYELWQRIDDYIDHVPEEA